MNSGDTLDPVAHLRHLAVDAEGAGRGAPVAERHHAQQPVVGHRWPAGVALEKKVEHNEDPSSSVY